MVRRYSIVRIKVHRSYEIEEAADTVGVTSQTVRQWIKDGLPALMEKRPYLILGRELKDYLNARQAARKVPKREGDFFCVGCKAHRRAAFGLTEIARLPTGRRVLQGFCEVCNTHCNRFLANTDPS